MPVDFQGPEQDLDLTLTASGSATVTGQFTPLNPYGMELIGFRYAVGKVGLDSDGFTYLVSNNPWTSAVTAKTSTKLTTDPRSVGVPPAGGVYPAPNTDLGFTGTELTSVSGLHLDLLNGAKLSYTLTDLSVPRTRMNENEFYDGDPQNGPTHYPAASSPIQLKMSGAINTLYIEQDSNQVPTFVSDGVGTGSFKIRAILHGSLTSTLRIGGFEVVPPLDTAPSTPFTLSGRYLVTDGGITTLELSGLKTVSLPLFSRPVLEDGLPVYAFTMTVDLSAAVLDFALNYSLTTQVPEPGSLLLLAIGAAAFFPLAWRRTRRWRRNA
ncbi:MAG: PEP-CTERM sorting domain-containing protein [Pirellulales bacterium]